MQVQVIACGHAVAMASGSPFRPSQTTMHTSANPRFLISVSTRSQYGVLLAGPLIPAGSVTAVIGCYLQERPMRPSCPEVTPLFLQSHYVTAARPSLLNFMIADKTRRSHFSR